jgi:ferric-dicitrate binding protein FerR (iron transport regulator)
MKNDKQSGLINALFLKFFNKETTEQENRDLYKWMNDSETNLKLFEEYKNTWDSLALLKEGGSIDADKDFITVMDRVKRRQRNFVKKIILYSSGAAAGIAILLSSLLFLQPDKVEKQEYVTEICVPNGEMKQVILQDGTRIWLNPGSLLCYNSWEKSPLREVYIKGRAYFEVSKDSLKPFIVKTDNVDIKVLGTKFNVESFEDGNTVETTVIEGCVAVFDKNRTLEKKGVNIKLNSNDQATYIRKSKSFLISEVNADFYRQWKDGILVFREKRFEDIAKELERQFNVQIAVEDNTLNEYTFTATFEKGKRIEDILNAFSMTYPFDYTIKGQTIIINNKTPMKS